MSSDKFIFFRKENYTVFVLDRVEYEILNLKDIRGRKKIIQSLNRLATRIPNKPEMWEALKSCKGITVYELKPRPYRLGCYKYGKNILILHIWRVQKNKSLKKSKDINKACEIAKEIKDEFERFVGRV